MGKICFLKIVKHWPQTQKPRGLGLTLECCRPPITNPQLLSMKEGSHNKTQIVRTSKKGPPYLSSKNNSGGQREEGHGVVHHVQGEQLQTYLLHHYQIEVPASSVDKFSAGWTNCMSPM